MGPPADRSVGFQARGLGRGEWDRAGARREGEWGACGVVGNKPTARPLVRGVFLRRTLRQTLDQGLSCPRYRDHLD